MCIHKIIKYIVIIIYLARYIKWISEGSCDMECELNKMVYP